jgi:bifunctional NMN adenylyltransferase/nudix hydrolase
VQPAQEEYDIGVIVGRFQVHELHQAHLDLINYVLDRHNKVVIVLGLSPLPVSTNNPLDFESRKQMILKWFPEVTVLYIKDMAEDEPWSKRLDALIKDVATPRQSVVLYGGRDSFIEHYHGHYPTQELVQTTFMSGTAQRKEIARSSTRASADFRAGAIWASQSRFPTVYTTVDIAVLNEDRTRVLLGRKPGETLYRFLGGFADPASENFEHDARREVAEEGGIEVSDLRYIGSFNIDDWRYRNEPDRIRTMLFTAKYLHGRPTPGDDIEEVRWFDIDQAPPTNIMPLHRPLMAALWDDLTR